MSTDPRKWFPIDANLWQEPGPKKLKWWQRKLAIYLRKCSGTYDDTDEQRPNLVLRSEKRIAADTDLSLNKVRQGIAHLRKWPSRRNPFITACTGTEITLRPLAQKFVRCPVWLWESPLPDDLKDCLLFIQSRFTRKNVAGEELFDCNLYGTKQPSVLRCCYLSGTDFRKRRRRLKRLVSFMVKSGLLVVDKWSTSKSAMVVRIYADEPSRNVSKVISRMRSAEHTPSEVHSKTFTKCIAGPSEVHSRASSSAYTPKSFSKSSNQNPFSNPAPQAAQGSGQGSKLKQMRDEPSNHFLHSESSLVELLKSCGEQLDLDRGMLSFEQSAQSLQRILKGMSLEDQEELLVRDLIWALNSDEWNGLQHSIGLRLSKKFCHRLKCELLVSLELRRKEKREEWRDSPEGRFRTVLQALGYFCIESLSFKWPPKDGCDLLFWLIWNRLPHHRTSFREDEHNEGSLWCAPPHQFLTEQESQDMFKEWKERVYGVEA